MKLSIAYINDVHGYLEPHPELFYFGGKEVIETAGGYSRIASIVKDIRDNNSNTLLFDGGDTFHGTLPLVQSKGEAIIPILNKMGFIQYYSYEPRSINCRINWGRNNKNAGRKP